METGRPSAPALLLRPGLQAAVAGGLALIVYLRTLAPTVMWYDMGEFQAAAYVLGIAHNTGYPLLLLLGKLFTLLPFGDVAYRVNLLSAVCGALTVALIYLLAIELTARRTAAALAALALAFSSTLWSNATWATSYDLNAALTAWILLLLARGIRRPQPATLWTCALLLGLGLANHRLILVTAPAIVCLAWRAHRTGQVRLGLSTLWPAAALFALGFSVNLYLPLRAAQNPPVNWGNPATLERFLTMLTTGYARSFVSPLGSLGRMEFVLRVLALFPVYEFTAVGLGLAALGGWQQWLRRRPWMVASLLLIGTNVVLISTYGIHNIFNYFQPIYLVLAVWLGAGASRVVEAVGGAADRLAQAGGRPVAGKRWFTAARLQGLAAGLLFALPLYLLLRDFPRLDRSGHRDARDFAAYLLDRAEPGSVVLADFWSWTPLRYLQVVEGRGPQVEVSNLLSVPGVDQELLLDELQAAEVTTYLAIGTEDTPRLQIGSHRLQLVAPNAIHYYPTWQVPLPRFKDLLVPSGSVLLAPAGPPDLSAAEVPPADRLAYRFAGGLELAGFHIDRLALRPGESFTADYTWRLEAPTGVDYWVDLLFTDAQGNVATRQGLPIWLHSHWVGGGAAPTSEWPAGQLMHERLDGLVPRAVAPGSYTLRAYVYVDDQRQRPAPLLDTGRPELGAVLAVLQVGPASP